MTLQGCPWLSAEAAANLGCSPEGYFKTGGAVKKHYPLSRSLAAFIVMSSTACDKESVGPDISYGEGPIAGRYNLMTVHGVAWPLLTDSVALPALLTSEGWYRFLKDDLVTFDSIPAKIYFNRNYETARNHATYIEIYDGSSSELPPNTCYTSVSVTYADSADNELIDPALGSEVGPVTDVSICSWEQVGSTINLTRPEDFPVTVTIWSDYFSLTATHSGDRLTMVIPRMSPGRYVTMVFER